MSNSHTSSCIVSNKNTAKTLGSGTLEVFATPALAALMENSAMLAASDTLEDGFTTVGGFIGVKHLQPSKIGDEIFATATLVESDGRKLAYQIIAKDQNGKTIGTAEHTRFVVNSAKFLEKLA